MSRKGKSFLTRISALMVALTFVCSAALAAASLTVPTGTQYTSEAVTVQFSGTAGGTAALYHVDFGDGTSYSTETAGSVTHKYTRAGAMTVTLTVVDTTGASSTDTSTVTVQNSPSAPNPTITAPTAGSNYGSAVTFKGYADNGSGGVDSYASKYTYMWDYDGDGTVDRTVVAGSTAYDSATDIVTTTYTYEAPGTYTAHLMIANQSGVVGHESTTHTVSVGDAMTVTAVASTTGDEIPLSVNFEATVSDSNNTDSSLWWDYNGDGIWDEEGTPASVNDADTSTGSCTYNTPGIYNVRVRMYNPDSATIYDGLTVTARYPSALTAILASPETGSEVLGNAVPVTVNIAPTSKVSSVTKVTFTITDGASYTYTKEVTTGIEESVTIAWDAQAAIEASNGLDHNDTVNISASVTDGTNTATTSTSTVTVLNTNTVFGGTTPTAEQVASDPQSAMDSLAPATGTVVVGFEDAAGEVSVVIVKCEPGDLATVSIGGKPGETTGMTLKTWAPSRTQLVGTGAIPAAGAPFGAGVFGDNGATSSGVAPMVYFVFQSRKDWTALTDIAAEATKPDMKGELTTGEFNKAMRSLDINTWANNGYVPGSGATGAAGTALEDFASGPVRFSFDPGAEEEGMGVIYWDPVANAWTEANAVTLVVLSGDNHVQSWRAQHFSGYVIVGYDAAGNPIYAEDDDDDGGWCSMSNGAVTWSKVAGTILPLMLVLAALAMLRRREA